MLFAFEGCYVKGSEDEKTAINFITSQGYKVVAQNGKTDKYILEKSKLYGGTESLPYQEAWSVQNIEPDKFFGKEISVFRFIVANHPLQKLNKHAENGVILYIMMSENKVIGGYSYPFGNSNEILIGGWCSSLDGNSLEDVTGLNYKQWSDNWAKKYGK